MFPQNHSARKRDKIRPDITFWFTVLKYVTANKQTKHNDDGSVQDCNISIANALEILQSCTEPSIKR